MTMIAPAPTLEEWNVFWREGETYATLCAKRVRHFTNEIRYNLAGMAVEKLVMGALMRRGALPEGHTLRDLMDAVESAGLVTGPLCERIRHMDDFQQICAFDTYTRTVPDDDEMAEIVEQVHALHARLREAL